ncbi:uncharacterized protein Z518_01290 [Rhinocladiella mackenziei CBS 650.93]|uniref:FAD-binding PCMH-type domain-containing protein n=1 Tax=Rhinocladiella mackenziei CBS 650.93 TaxID=1442369 RepID=A0A0D2IVY7_9EURO|nr:uncharacterized protein Z518_01290 [Rhinocladiella mackenziei CBS 650.93]KIX10209.1 hypothetical protein Z518_01290 [Rhinocladiella mackenziei CBS 650.93]
MFAVRSGGHNSNPGFASVGDSGVLLDLGSLNQITLSKDKDFVSLGPRAKWDQVYGELEKNKLTVVGGRVVGVGVGGLIIGGGMSHFSNAWGMVCDHVKNMEVVLANSRIVQANENENSDLFRALKGGGANFGIVTRFDLYTNPEYQVWYSTKMYSVEDKDRVVKAAIEVQQAMDEDDRIGFYLTVGTEFFCGWHVVQGTEFPAVFHAFDGIKPMAVPVPETVGTQ